MTIIIVVNILIDNKLTSLEGIDALKNLTDLDCSQNSIASTSPGFRSLPLQKLYMVRRLDFSRMF